VAFFDRLRITFYGMTTSGIADYKQV